MCKFLMCQPDFFRVDYVINPWMKVGKVDSVRALLQWNNLVSVYRSLGVEVLVITQDEKCPDMVFAADQGIVVNQQTILLSHFRYQQRRAESNLYADWYRHHHFNVVSLPEDVYFEGGGELLPWGRKYLLGVGHRSHHESVEVVSRILNQEVVKLELISPHFYHLDTCLLVIDQQTACFYPPAFSDQSQTFLHQNFSNLITITDHDASAFSANSVVIGNKVIMQTGGRHLPDKIKKLGYEVVEVDVSEFNFAGGGIHCLTGVLAI